MIEHTQASGRPITGKDMDDNTEQVSWNKESITMWNVSTRLAIVSFANTNQMSIILDIFLSVLVSHLLLGDLYFWNLEFALHIIS